MITDEEFRRISVFMKQKYGIDLSQKKTIVNGRLENYIKYLLQTVSYTHLTLPTN